MHGSIAAGMDISVFAHIRRRTISYLSHSNWKYQVLCLECLVPSDKIARVKLSISYFWKLSEYQFSICQSILVCGSNVYCSRLCSLHILPFCVAQNSTNLYSVFLPQSHYLKNYFLQKKRENKKKAKILLSVLHLTTAQYFLHYIFILLLCGGAITWPSPPQRAEMPL